MDTRGTWGGGGGGEGLSNYACTTLESNFLTNQHMHTYTIKHTQVHTHALKHIQAWLVFEGSIPTCAGFRSENFFLTFICEHKWKVKKMGNEANGLMLKCTACSCSLPHCSTFTWLKKQEWNSSICN